MIDRKHLCHLVEFNRRKSGVIPALSRNREALDAKPDLPKQPVILEVRDRFISIKLINPNTPPRRIFLSPQVPEQAKGI